MRVFFSGNFKLVEIHCSDGESCFPDSISELRACFRLPGLPSSGTFALRKSAAAGRDKKKTIKVKHGARQQSRLACILPHDRCLSSAVRALRCVSNNPTSCLASTLRSLPHASGIKRGGEREVGTEALPRKYLLVLPLAVPNSSSWRRMVMKKAACYLVSAHALAVVGPLLLPRMAPEWRGRRCEQRSTRQRAIAPWGTLG